MVGRTMQFSRHNENTTSRSCVNITNKGDGGDGDDEEMIDLVEDGGEDEEADRVTETRVARSERGKQPVYHHEIYERLVNLVSSQGSYTYEPPDHGIDSMDITSFHPDQRDWSSTRDHRAPILTLWSEPPGSAPTYPIGFLLFNRRLILDYAGNPIRAFRNLPLTISSAVKGFRLETWTRQDFRRLRTDDIRARLRTRNTPNGRQPLYKKGDLTDRANAFRLKSGLVSFHKRNDAVRLAARAFMDSLRTEVQRASNRAIDRDLTFDELATLKEVSRRGPVNAAAGSNASAGAITLAPAPAPAATVTPTSQPTRRYRTPPPIPPTPPRAQTLPDSRDDVPETCKESYILRNALEESIEHFKKLTGRTPKPTKPTESYSSQWNVLQTQFEPIWKSLMPAEETPLLFKLCARTGGIDRWDSEMHVGGEKRDREGEMFLEYMDATQKGTAYVGPDGNWRSVRDTWCNSHAKPTEGHWGRSGSTSEEESEESSKEGSEGESEEGSDEEYDYAE